MRASSLPPMSSSLTHAHRMDGFCSQNADQLGSLAGPSLLTVYVGVVECAPSSLPPASSSLTQGKPSEDARRGRCHPLEAGFWPLWMTPLPRTTITEY